MRSSLLLRPFGLTCAGMASLVALCFFLPVASFGVSAVRAMKLHKEASKAITKNPKLLEAPVPRELKVDFENATGKPRQGTVTYKTILKETEESFRASIPNVKVTVSAKPDACDVRYKPVIGGEFTDFGRTVAEKSVEPRTYEFVCVCSDRSAPSKIEECVQDTNVDFECKK